jgi:hypothetical protein
MVRIKPEAFERDGGARALRGLTGAADQTAAATTTDDADGVHGGGGGGNSNRATTSPADEAVKRRRKADREDGDVEAVPSIDEKATATATGTGTGTGTKPDARDRPTREQLTAAAVTAATAEGFDPVGSRQAALADASLPSVCIIVPVHNAASWLDECLASVLTQTYRGSMQVSIYDDASTDGSDEVIRSWVPVLHAGGVSVVASGSRWPQSRGGGDGGEARAGGIGHGKNRSVAQSSGDFLVFLDADDIMRPRRVEVQVALATANPTAIVGGCWRRYPAGSTEHYETWANTLEDPRGLWLEQFREVTVQMPTWCIHRRVFDAVGGFVESPPEDGEGEDLIFFQRHLDLHGATNTAVGRPSLVRAGSPTDPVLLYRWSPGSGAARVSRQQLLKIRTAAFERRVLSQPAWERFAVWGAVGLYTLTHLADPYSLRAPGFNPRAYDVKNLVRMILLITNDATCTATARDATGATLYPS